MITPKTNWVAADFFNVTDYNRITANLNELAVAVGVATVSFRAADYYTVWMITDRAAIAGLYNAIATAIGWNLSVSTTKGFWFDYKELDQLERICELYTSKDTKAAYGLDYVHGDGLYYGGGIIE